MDSTSRPKIAVSLAQSGRKTYSSSTSCRPLASLTHAVAKHGGALRSNVPTKAFEFLRELGSVLEVDVSVTSEAFDSDRESVLSSSSIHDSDHHRWGQQIAALNDSTEESERIALFDEVREGMKGCSVNEALERLKQVEHIAESLHKELRTRQRVHQEAIEELRENFARKESKLHAHTEHIKHGFPPNVVFAHDLNVLVPDIQQMMVHGGALCAFGTTGHATAHRLVQLVSRNSSLLFDPVVIDVPEGREDSDADTAVGELNDSAVSVAAVEITAEGTAVNLLGRRGNLRAFYQEHYGVTFPDLITVSVKSASDIARLVDSHAVSAVESMSAVVWMVKRGDCCYGPNRIVIVGLPSHAAPDDVNPKKIALLLQEGQLASFVCSDDIKTLSPTYERMGGRLQHRWRCRRDSGQQTISRIVHKTNPPALGQVQRAISRLRSPCHLSYGEIYATLRASSDSGVTFGEETPRPQQAHVEPQQGSRQDNPVMDILQDKLDSVMSSQNEILRSLQTHTQDDLPSEVPAMLYNELQLKLSSMERLVEEKEAQLQAAFQAQRSASTASPYGTYKSATPQLLRRPLLCSPASGSSALPPHVPRPEFNRGSSGENFWDLRREPRAVREALTSRGRSPALQEIRSAHSADFHSFTRTTSAKQSFTLGSPAPNITRILGTPVIVEHREPRTHSADFRDRTSPGGSVIARGATGPDGRTIMLAGSGNVFSQLNVMARNGAARVSATGQAIRAGLYGCNGSTTGIPITMAPRHYSTIGRSPASPPFSPQFPHQASVLCATPQSPYGLSPVPPTPRSCVLREVRGTSCEKIFSPRSPKRNVLR